MCNIREKNTRQILEELSFEFKFLVNEIRLIEGTISELIGKSDQNLRTKHLVSLQKLDQIIQTIDSLSIFTMNVSKSNLSMSEFQEEIKQIKLESVRNRIGPNFGVNKTDGADISRNRVDFFD